MVITFYLFKMFFNFCETCSSKLPPHLSNTYVKNDYLKYFKKYEAYNKTLV